MTDGKPTPNLRRTISDLPWRGLGAPRDAHDDRDDATVLSALAAVLAILPPGQRRALLAMTERTGARCSVADRRGALQARRAAWRRGLVLAPLWRLRLAVRRTGVGRHPEPPGELGAGGAESRHDGSHPAPKTPASRRHRSG